MKEKVFSYMEQHQMLRPGEQVLVGFSGGADSTALLLLLKEYGQRHQNTVCAVHVHHGIRGETADRDALFCEEFCKKWEIPFRIFYRNVPDYAKEHRMSLEEAGRELRYEVFSACLQEGMGAKAALAHHQNDQAETMLFRLGRGTGLKGLCGMEPVRGAYIRPLLCVTRPEIQNWLQEQEISWTEDESNAELQYMRNRIRHQVLEPMEEMLPGAAVRMAGTAARLRELESWAEQETERFWDQCVQQREEGWEVELSVFEKLHPALQKMLMMRIMECLTGGRNAEAVHAEQLCRLTSGRRGSRIDLPEGCFAQLGYQTLQIRKKQTVPEEQLPPMEVKEGLLSYGGYEFLVKVESAAENEEIPINRYTKWFDYDKIKHGIVLRRRQPGDYLANGVHSHKKLKDYLIDSKIPREERDRMILLADGSHILWAVGMRISESYKVTEQTRKILKIQMKNMEE